MVIHAAAPRSDSVEERIARQRAITSSIIRAAGQDNLIIEMETGRSHMSTADYAVAMLDEIETPRHHRQRFTVGS